MWFQWASFPTLNALTERAKLYAEAWGRTFAMGWSDDFICHFLPKWSKVWPAWLQLELHVFSIFPEVLYVLMSLHELIFSVEHLPTANLSFLCHKLLAMICSCKIIANSSRWRLHKRPVLTNKFDNLSLAVSRTSGTIWGSVICKLHDPPSLPCRLRWTSFIQHMVNKFSLARW